MGVKGIIAYKTYIAIGEHKKYIGTISEISIQLKGIIAFNYVLLYASSRIRKHL